MGSPGRSAPARTRRASFSASHDATTTWSGFREVCRQAGLSVLEHAVSQDIEVVTDQGTEFLGVFHANL